MGIDAELLIRYRGETPNDIQLARWSWDLCRAIGARKFFISDGLPQPDYAAASKAWYAAFCAHPLHPDYEAKKEGAHQAILDAIGRAPTQLRHAIELTNCRYPIDDDSDVPKTHWAPGLAWTQDGEPILAQPGECFMSVNLMTRYYGPGYERGDILLICSIAEWIEAVMQPCEVWYGGDSSGVEAELFDAAARARMRAHLFGPNGRDYFQHEARGTFPTPKPCGLCIPDEPRFNRHGWGNDYVAVNCAGCGKSFESRDGGTSWIVAKDD